MSAEQLTVNDHMILDEPIAGNPIVVNAAYNLLLNNTIVDNLISDNPMTDISIISDSDMNISDNENSTIDVNLCIEFRTVKFRLEKPHLVEKFALIDNYYDFDYEYIRDIDTWRDRNMYFIMPFGIESTQLLANLYAARNYLLRSLVNNGRIPLGMGPTI